MEKHTRTFFVDFIKNAILKRGASLQRREIRKMRLASGNGALTLLKLRLWDVWGGSTVYAYPEHHYTFCLISHVINPSFFMKTLMLLIGSLYRDLGCELLMMRRVFLLSL